MRVRLPGVASAAAVCVEVVGGDTLEVTAAAGGSDGDGDDGGGGGGGRVGTFHVISFLQSTHG